MTRGVFRYLVAPLVCVGLLSGCRFDLFDRREPWRAQAEEKCLAEKGVTVSAYVEPARGIDGPGVCGMEHPFRVTALDDGIVAVQPRATLACPMVRDLNIWLDQVVQPAALAWMGQPVVGIRQMSSYSCRGMNGSATAKISEHAFGNALDIGAFQFADGTTITIKDNWRGPKEARGFLLQVQAGACDMFTTVLAPGSNIFHYDHIHVDLMRHAKGRTICKPAPRPMAPPVLMARQPGPAGGGLIAPPSGPPPLFAPPSGPAPLFARPSAPAPQMRQMPQPANIPPPGAPLDILPHPPEHGLEDFEPEQAAAPQEPPRPPYAQGQPIYAPAPQRSYPAPGDPYQPVLTPPGTLPAIPRPPGPMSYAPGDATGAGPFETGTIANRKYYTVPIPQPSTIPLPRAEPGAD
ncbi:extensin family protein [Aquabacter spiritensis]|uniref:Extensin-like protein n=1 Tax=Aquabacter spiritensis TaxID=933073 RepID=A0A4R3M4A3_9HYPH|nr:extensin family protein [Aquabacter spiritensis]TCT06015.1 extensin-like protein [Aquabacter spiritensis]